LAVLSSAEAAALVHSQDPRTPAVYHSSRDAALNIAKGLKPEIDACGFAGPCMALAIPGIPFDQKQDAGIHLSIYNRPGNAADGVKYSPPDVDIAKSKQGREVEFELEGTIKILNGSEANDMKVGGCYYVSLSCGQTATDAANRIKQDLGLAEDPTQRFHMTIATLAPAWMPFHPKSAFVASEHGQGMLAEMAEALQIQRHGDSATGFSGFNADATTGWTTHANTCAQWAKENNAIKAQIAELAKDDACAADKAALEEQFRDIRSLGFCDPVGRNEKLTCISVPPRASQDKFLAQTQARQQKTLGLIETYRLSIS